MDDSKDSTGLDKPLVEVQVLNVRLPDEIVKWIDSLVEANVYGSRSEAVRDFIRDYVRKSR